MAHLVRETIQNAMDAKLDGLAEPDTNSLTNAEVCCDAH